MLLHLRLCYGCTYDASQHESHEGSKTAMEAAKPLWRQHKLRNVQPFLNSHSHVGDLRFGPSSTARGTWYGAACPPAVSNLPGWLLYSKIQSSRATDEGGVYETQLRKQVMRTANRKHHLPRIINTFDRSPGCHGTCGEWYMCGV